jgi:phage terminase small subunit
VALTPKQERFVQEYLVDLNATQAAARAGYSKKTADVQGARLLGNVKVQVVIQEAMQKRSQRTEITQDWVLEELRKVAAANGAVYAKVVTKEQPETVLDEDTGEEKKVARVTQFVELTDTDDLTADQKAAISGIEQTRNGIKVSTYDKVKALELLGKHLGMFDGPSGDTAPATVVVKYDYGDG